jgi:hypothetical protein
MNTMQPVIGAELKPSLINGDLRVERATCEVGGLSHASLCFCRTSRSIVASHGRVSGFINSSAFARTGRIRIKLVAGDRDVETWSCLVEFDPLLNYSGCRWNYVEDNSECGPSRYSDWLRAGRSGDRIPVGAIFFAHVQTGPGAHPASCTMGTGSFPGVKRPPRLTTHPLLAPRLNISRAIPLHPL